MMEHKSGEHDGFSHRYNTHHLVYFETFRYIGNAIAREKEIKGWRRERKNELVESKTLDGKILAPTGKLNV